MKPNSILFLLFFIAVSEGSCTLRSEFTFSSPDGNIITAMKFNPVQGTLTHCVVSRDKEIIIPGRLVVSVEKKIYEHGE